MSFIKRKWINLLIITISFLVLLVIGLLTINFHPMLKQNITIYLFVFGFTDFILLIDPFISIFKYYFCTYPNLYIGKIGKVIIHEHRIINYSIVVEIEYLNEKNEVVNITSSNNIILKSSLSVDAIRMKLLNKEVKFYRLIEENIAYIAKVDVNI